MDTVKKAKLFLILFISCLIIAIAACVVAGISFYYYWNYKKKAEIAVNYVSGMVNQSQTAVQAASYLKSAYKTCEYFDAGCNGDKEVPIVIEVKLYDDNGNTLLEYGSSDVSWGTIRAANGSSSSSSSSSESPESYMAYVSQICKGLTVSKLLNKMGVDSYIVSSNSSSGGKRLSNSYIKFSYAYPEIRIVKTIKFPLDGYSYVEGDGNIEDVIKDKWVDAISIAEVEYCSSSGSSSGSSNDSSNVVSN